MKPEMKKLIIANLPYLLFVYLFGNLMQCVSKDYPTSFVITDPKGSLIGEVGQLLVRCGYRVKVLNTIMGTRKTLTTKTIGLLMMKPPRLFAGFTAWR